MVNICYDTIWAKEKLMVQILKEKVLSTANSGGRVKKIKSGQSIFPIDGQR